MFPKETLHELVGRGLEVAGNPSFAEFELSFPCLTSVLASRGATPATDVAGVHPGQGHIDCYMCCGSCDSPGMSHEGVEAWRIPGESRVPRRRHSREHSPA